MKSTVEEIIGVIDLSLSVLLSFFFLRVKKLVMGGDAMADVTGFFLFFGSGSFHSYIVLYYISRIFTYPGGEIGVDS